MTTTGLFPKNPRVTTVRETRAAVLTGLGRPLDILTLGIPPLKPGQVLVEIRYSGICRSQLMEVRGGRGSDPHLPHTLGHEASGVVLETASGVRKVRPGDSVVISWIRGSGQEAETAVYSSPLGPVNSGAVSTFMSRAVVSENRLTPIPKDMPLPEAALLGCAISTGAGIILHTAAVKPDESVCVFGVGGIGMSAVLAAKIAKATPIIAVDIFDHKLDLAKRLGATHLVNASRMDPREAIAAITKEQGVDCAVEAAGVTAAMEAAFGVTGAGGICVIAGNLKPGERMSIDPFDLIRGKRLVGSLGGGTMTDRDIPLYVDWFLSGRLPANLLITHRYPLEAINEALSDLEKGDIGRALVEMEVRTD